MTSFPKVMVPLNLKSRFLRWSQTYTGPTLRIFHIILALPTYEVVTYVKINTSTYNFLICLNQDNTMQAEFWLKFLILEWSNCIKYMELNDQLRGFYRISDTFYCKTDVDLQY